MNFLKPKFWDDNKISLLSILLFPISLLFKLLNFLKRSLTKSNKSPIPVICVGNIYLGGTGKTPLCIEIFSILKKLNVNPVFIRKHYDLYQDEVELQKKIGPVYQSKKRIEAIKKAVMDKADIAILDDGFQDFSIKKNLSIVCFNEKQWLGNGLNIPAGPLRENFSAIKRANCIVVNGEKNEKIENQVFSISKELKIFYSKYEPQNINNFKNAQVIAIDEAQFFGKEIIEVCNKLANDGKRVIVAGLDMDYKGRPFGPMPNLMAIAEYVTKLHAICTKTGKMANYTSRKVDDKTLIMVGDKDKYEALSREAFYNKKSK